MFEKSLSDLVRGIRNHKKDEANYISTCIQEIKDELKQDMAKKTVAIQKLTYLQMLGYDMSWAAFNVVEVMSQQKFTGKRVGYLAASQSFHEGTEVVMLATNLLKKDFNSTNQYESGIALNTLANICTPDLARDLASDIVSLMNNSKPYTRKKAVLVMYKVFLNFPDSLRPSFPKLKEKLDDQDQAVISAAVNVVCELARKNPKNYLSLAPVLFKLLTSNYNNWMLIKIIKLFGALTPYEPRLAKKLVDPLTNLINSTPAMSLIYECIQTCTIGMGEYLPIIKLCTAKLRAFVEDPDQNLKYLGLLAMNNIMKIHPKAVAEHRDLVLNCLDDEDVTIRLRALDLLTGMVTKRNLPEIVRKLLEHIERAEGTYRDELVHKIIILCSQNSYAYITDFEWYLTVLVQLSHVNGTTHGSLIASQLLDVVIRVKVVRPFGVRQLAAVIRDPRYLANPESNGVCEVLYAAAWAVGEFARYLDNPLETIDSLLQPRATVLPAHIQSIYTHSVLKLFAFLVAAAYGHVTEDEEVEGGNEIVEVLPEQITEASTTITTRLQVFAQSVHLEVQERACFVLEVLRLYNNIKDQDDGVVTAELAALFEEPLNPVAKGANKKVPIPEGLDLDTPLNDEPPEEPDEDDEPVAEFTPSEEGGDDRHREALMDEDEEDDYFKEAPKKQEPQKAQRPSSVYHLGSRTTSKPQAIASEDLTIPVVSLPQTSLGAMVVGSPKKQIISNKAKAKSYVVDTTEEMPEGASLSDEEDKKKKKKPQTTGKLSGADALSEINLSAPLGEHEALPVQRHRTDVLQEQKAKEPARQQRPSRPEPREGERRRRPEGGERERRPSARRPQQTEGQLIDLGLGGDSPSAAQVKVVQDEDYQEVSSPAVEAPAPGQRARRPRPEGERRHRPDGERPRRPRPEGEAGERPRRPRPEGEAGERPRRPRPEGEGGHGKRPAAAAAAAAAPAGTGKKPSFKPLFDGDDLRAAYEIRVNLAERGKLNVALIIENKSEEDLSKVEVNISDTMNVRLVRSAPGVASQVEDIGAKKRVQHLLPIAISNVTLPQKIKGTISYEYLGDIRKTEFTLNAPVGSFIGGVSVQKEEFATIAKDSAPSLASARVKLQGDFKTTLDAIIAVVRADVVQSSPTVASAYGRSALGHHVALLIKDKSSEGIVSVDIKSNDAALANALAQEVNVIRA